MELGQTDCEEVNILKITGLRASEDTEQGERERYHGAEKRKNSYEMHNEDASVQSLDQLEIRERFRTGELLRAEASKQQI